ncbi:MAG: nucleotidyltransferase family protein [Desulfobacterales bacterium]
MLCKIKLLSFGNGWDMRRERILKMLAESTDIKHRFSVKSFYLFGSVARGEEQESSDVDLLVEYEPDARVGMFQFVRLRRELSERLSCDVDLATRESLHKDLREDILKEAVHAA